MSSSLSKIPPGVQYIFGREARARRWIERQIMEVFAGWSYSEMILPIFDYADLFALGMGRDQAEMTYRFTGRDGKLLALRPEMTSLVARTVATRFGNRERPIRLCYSGEVFRWDEPRGGRQYEFHQIGLEHIGSDRLEADTEALVVAIEALTRLGLKGRRARACWRRSAALCGSRRFPRAPRSSSTVAATGRRRSSPTSSWSASTT
jgi:ATP phosphoribosyltransferase regulatory subunit